jgi:hypothetical protein
MKKLLILFLVVLLVGCVPTLSVNVHRRHHVYELRRSHFYTAPIWIPNRGIVLQQHYIPRVKRPIPGRRSRN